MEGHDIGPELAQGLAGSTDEEEVIENGAGIPEDNFLRQLRAKREAFKKPRFLKISIPGFDDLLVARYGMPVDAWELSKKIAERVQKSKNPKAEIIAMADTLISACDSFLIKRGDKLIPAQEAYPDLGDEPVKYDRELAALLRLKENDTARKIVYQLFGNNDMAIWGHYNELATWMQDNRREDDEDF